MSSPANKIFCTGCFSKLDISDVKKGTPITCPACSEEILIDHVFKPENTPKAKSKSKPLSKNKPKAKTPLKKAKPKPLSKNKLKAKTQSKAKAHPKPAPIIKKEKKGETPQEQPSLLNTKAKAKSPALSVNAPTVSPVRKRKKSKNHTPLIFAALAIIAVLSFIFLASSSKSDTTKQISQNKTTVIDQQKSQEIKKKQKELKKQQLVAKQEEEKKQKELEEKKLLARQKEEKKQKELEKQQLVAKQEEEKKQKELEDFLAFTKPSEEQKKIFASLPPVSHTHLNRLINKHCIDCHNPKKRKGDLNLQIFKDPASLFRAYQIIKHSFEYIAHKEMPPKGENITAEDQHELENYFRKIIYSLEGTQPKIRRSATIRRLTPYEYDYTIKDITGLDLKIGDSFPGDGNGNQGFSNDANLMSISPLLMEKMLDASQLISTYSSFDIHNGIRFNSKPGLADSATDFENNTQKTLYSLLKPIYKTGFNIERQLPSLMKAVAEQYLGNSQRSPDAIASSHGIHIGFLTRGIKYFSTSTGKSEQENNALKRWRSLRRGDVKKEDLNEAIKEFVQFYKESSRILADRANKERKKHIRMAWNTENLFTLNTETLNKILKGGLLLKYQQAQSYYNFSKYSSSSKEVYSFIQPHIYKFLYKVYRRPPSEQELALRVRDVLKDSVKYGIPLATRVLVIREFASMNFAFRIETKKSAAIDDYDLASRLSYFIWGGPPDNELYTLAEKGQLKNEDVLKNQVIRMLKDKKSARLAKHFANQWLQFGEILEVQGPDTQNYKNFDKSLAKDMWQETAMCFNYIVKNDRSILEVLDADYTIINNRLSRLYGLNQSSSSFKKVSLKNSKRGGILGHASFLTMTSFGKRTSPIIRGNWVLNNLLGLKTPPPPMDVPPLPEGEMVNENFTLKEQLKQHRDNAACKSCHKKIDPLGIVLENYDTVGRWRNSYTDEKAKVDSISEIDGKSVTGPQGLKKYLLDNKVKFLRNLSRKLVSYSLGRSTEFYDNYLINNMIENSIHNDYKFSSLIQAIVLSPQFQHK